MGKFAGDLKKYNKYALRNARAELNSEVADSRLNWLWWIIEPLCFMLIYTFVFGYVFKTKTGYFASFVIIGRTVWQYFNRVISGSVMTIQRNRGLIKNVYVPKTILLISKSYTYLFKMGISLVLCLGLMAFQRVPFSWTILFIFPIIMVLYIVTFGIGLILMHFGTWLTDLQNLVDIGLNLLFYLSGVFFNIKERLHGTLQYVVLRVNPSAFLMSEMRKVMLEGKLPSFEGLGVWLLIGLVLCFIGIRLVNKNENNYAKAV